MQTLLDSTAAITPGIIATAMPILPAPDNPTMYYAFIVLCGGVALLAGANQLITFIRSFKEQPPPAITYATKVELERYRRELLGEIGSIERKLDDINRIQEERSEKIHNRVNTILSAVSRIEGIVEGKGRHEHHT